MSLPTPDVLLFDLDGTLVDSVADLAASANAARVAHGAPPLPEQVIRGYIGDGARKLMERVLDGLDLDLGAGFREFRAHYGRHCLDRTRPYPGVVETLRRLKPRPLGIVSNKPQAFTEKVARGLGLTEFCEVVVGARPEVPVKPAPDLLQLALAGFPGRPQRAWMVGDSLNDLRSGRAAGCTTVAVTYGLGAIADLRAEAPDALVDAMPELLDLLT